MYPSLPDLQTSIFPKGQAVYSSFSSYSTFSSGGQTVNNVCCTFKSNNMTHYHTLDKLYQFSLQCDLERVH